MADNTPTVITLPTDPEMLQEAVESMALELAHRKIVLRGTKDPRIDGVKCSVGGEYYDLSQTPMKIYEKIGNGDKEWCSKFDERIFEVGKSTNNVVDSRLTLVDSVKKEYNYIVPECVNFIELLPTSNEVLILNVIVEKPTKTQERLSIKLNPLSTGTTVNIKSLDITRGTPDTVGTTVYKIDNQDSITLNDTNSKTTLVACDNYYLTL